MDKLYTVKEVALLFKVHSKTVKNYINSGKLKASWLGNRWRIKQEDVELFINERATIKEYI